MTPQRQSALRKIYIFKKRCNEGVQDLFEAYGKFGFKHSGAIALTSVLTCLCLGLGFAFIKFEYQPQRLYALPNSEAVQDEIYYGEVVPRSKRFTNNSFFGLMKTETGTTTSTGEHPASMFDETILRKFEKIDEFIREELSVTIPENNDNGLSGQTVTFQDVCYRISDLEPVKFDDENKTSRRKEVTTTTAPTAVVNGTSATTSLPKCRFMSPLLLWNSPAQYGQPIWTKNWPFVPNVRAMSVTKADLVLANPEIEEFPNGAKRILGSTGMMWLYYTSAESPYARAWEIKFAEFINERRGLGLDGFVESLYVDNPVKKMPPSPSGKGSGPRIELYGIGSPSWEEELKKTTKLDKRLLRDYSLGVALTAIYTCFVNFKSFRSVTRFEGKAVCSLFGVLSAILGYIGGAGLAYLLGLMHTPTMNASPFLTVGIGLDDTFIILGFYNMLKPSCALNPDIRCSKTLKESGVAISVTTATNVVSFAVGAMTSGYVAVRNFCLLTAASLLGGFIMNLALFYPCLCYFARRESRQLQQFLEKSTNADPPAASTTTNIAGIPVLPSPTETDDLASPVNRSESIAADSQGIITTAATGTGKKVLTVSSCQNLAPAYPLAVLPKAFEVIGNSRALKPLSKTDPLPPPQPNLMDSYELVSAKWALHCQKRALKKELTRHHEPEQGSTTMWDRAAVAFRRSLPASFSFLKRRRGSTSPSMTFHTGGDALLHMRSVDFSSMSPRTLEGYMNRTQEALACLERRSTFDESSGPSKSERLGLFLARILFCKRWYAILGALFMSTLLLFSIYSIFFNLRVGLNFEDLMPTDSYLKESLNEMTKTFNVFPYTIDLLITAPEGKEEAPYWNAETVERMRRIDFDLKRLSTTQYGLNALFLFLQRQPDAIARPPIEENEARYRFTKSLHEWLDTDIIGVEARDRFVWTTKPDGTVFLKALRVEIFLWNLLDSVQQTSAMINVRKVCKGESIINPVVTTAPNDNNSANKIIPITDAIMNEVSPFAAPNEDFKILGKPKFIVPQDSLEVNHFQITPVMETFKYFESDVTIVRSTILNMLIAFVAVMFVSGLGV